jgi:thiol-disulfide isomerase/thioredoxin
MSADQGKADKIDRSKAGEAAPTSPFKAPDGETVTLASFKGKPVLLNLWATWCAPCVREMPTLDALAVREAGKLQVLTVSQDLEGAAKVTPFFEKAQFKALKPYLDTDVALSTGYGVNLPTTILYDSAGKEVWRVSGDMDWAGAQAAKLIAEAR